MSYKSLQLLLVACSLAGCAPAMNPPPATTLPTTSPAEVKSRAWQNRILAVFADEESDPRLEEQRKLLGPGVAEFRKRDLLFVEVVGDDPLRDALGVPRSGFHVRLVGKDGTTKLQDTEPVPLRRLLDVIDGMPMRLDEIRSDPSKR